MTLLIEVTSERLDLEQQRSLAAIFAQVCHQNKIETPENVHTRFIELDTDTYFMPALGTPTDIVMKSLSEITMDVPDPETLRAIFKVTVYGVALLEDVKARLLASMRSEIRDHLKIPASQILTVSA